MNEKIGFDVRVQWPDHPTHGLIGRILRVVPDSDQYRVALEDGTERSYRDRQLVRVRKVVKWVDWADQPATTETGFENFKRCADGSLSHDMLGQHSCPACGFVPKFLKAETGPKPCSCGAMYTAAAHLPDCSFWLPKTETAPKQRLTTREAVDKFLASGESETAPGVLSDAEALLFMLDAPAESLPKLLEAYRARRASRPETAPQGTPFKMPPELAYLEEPPSRKVCWSCGVSTGAVDSCPAHPKGVVK